MCVEKREKVTDRHTVYYKCVSCVIALLMSLTCTVGPIPQNIPLFIMKPFSIHLTSVNVVRI